MSSDNETSLHMIDGITSLVTLGQFIICVGGLFLYILTCWIIIKHRKTAFANPFYTFALALAVPDCLHLCMQLLCAIPIVFIGYENFPMVYVAMCGYLTDAAYWSLAPMTVVIGVNRYIAVCHFQSYKRMFSPFRVKVLVIICWAMGFSIPSLMYGCTCFYLFKGKLLNFYLFCSV